MKAISNVFLVLMTLVASASNLPNEKRIILTELNGKQIKSTSIYLTINEEEKVISGKSGCNSFTINYKSYNNRSCIKTGDGISTMMACDEATMKLEKEFMDAFTNKKFRVSLKSNKVYFKNWWGKCIMVFDVQTEKSIWSFIGKNDWKLFQLNNVGQDYGKAAIKFDTTAKKVSGNAGCNNFFGSYEVEGEFITFTQMGSTKMACMDEASNKTEVEFLKVLSGKKLRFDLADQTLNFYDEDRLVMMFGVVR